MCDFYFHEAKIQGYVSLLPGCVVLHHEHELPLDPLHAIEVLVAGLPTVQYSTVRYSTVQYNILQYSTIQYSTVQKTIQKTVH